MLHNGIEPGDRAVKSACFEKTEHFGYHAGVVHHESMRNGQHNVIRHTCNPGRGDADFSVVSSRQERREVGVERLVSRYNTDFKGDGRQPARQAFGSGPKLRASGAIDAAQAEARAFLDKARHNLDGLPDNIYKRSMLDLCDFVVQRTY